MNEYGRSIFESERSELGTLMYRLKYRSDQTAATDIVETVANYLERRLRDGIRKFDLIIPVPPSAARVVQPVLLLADGIGDKIGIPVDNCIIATRETGQLKNITDPAARSAVLEGLFKVDPAITENKHILLFDDLFRSGATMNAITKILLGQGRATSVRALTITCTRSNT